MKTDLKKVHEYFLRKSATRKLFLKSLLKYLGFVLLWLKTSLIT